MLKNWRTHRQLVTLPDLYLRIILCATVHTAHACNTRTEPILGTQEILIELRNTLKLCVTRSLAKNVPNSKTERFVHFSSHLFNSFFSWFRIFGVFFTNLPRHLNFLLLCVCLVQRMTLLILILSGVYTLHTLSINRSSLCLYSVWAEVHCALGQYMLKICLLVGTL